WTHAWQIPQTPVAKRNPISTIDPALARDPAIEAAKIKVVGPLALAMKAESEDPQGTAGPESPNDTSSTQPTAFDHVERSATPKPRRFHASFLVKNYSFYRLLVPAHTSSPRLYGRFAAFSPGPDKKAASTEFLLLDEEQFKDFTHGNAGDSLFSSESSNGTVDIDLSPSIFESKHYYLVFRSPDKRARIVKADLTASFE